MPAPGAANEPFATLETMADHGSGPADRLPRDRSAAVAALFDAYYPQLVRLARLLVDDTASAEDVVMDAFTSLHRRWLAIRDPDQAYRYLRSCVLNGARSQLRRRRVARARTPAAWVDSQQDTSEEGTERAMVMQALRELSPRQRQTLVLRYYLDLSEAEIARELHISQGSVKTHTSRGLAALRNAWEASR